MSSTGLGCHGALANCRIAHVLGIPLMISYLFAFYFSDVLVKNMGRRYEFFGSFACLKSFENKKKKNKTSNFTTTKVFKVSDLDFLFKFQVSDEQASETV